MKKLQLWMDKKGWHDGQVAAAVKVSRVQISRIRRGVTGASPQTARALEKLTGIKWWNFVEDAPVKRAPRSR